MEPFILAIDIGTSSCKAVVFSEELSATFEGRGRYPLYTDENGNVEQKPSEILAGIISSIKELKASGCDLKSIRAISFSSQISAQCLVRRDGEILTNIFSWMDRRAKQESDCIERDFSKAELIKLSGMDMIVNPSYSPAKLLWMKNHIPELVEKADFFVQVKELIIHYLTNNWVSDANSLKGLVHPDTEAPIQELFDYIDVPTSMIPRITKPYEIAGYLLSGVEGFKDFSPGIPIITGWNDMNAAFLGMVGFPEKCVGLDMTGTSEHIGIISPRIAEQYSSVPGMNTVPFLNNHKAIYGVTSSGGQAAEWFSSSIIGKKTANEYFRSFPNLNDFPKPDRNLFFLPYIEGERNPYSMPNARGVIYGLQRKHNSNDIALSLLEGVCFALKTMCECLPEKPDKIVVAGGAAKNSAWNELKATILGIPYETLEVNEAGCNGAAMLAVFALSNREEWINIQKRMLKKTNRFEPNQIEEQFYKEKYTKYVHLLNIARNLYDED